MAKDLESVKRECLISEEQEKILTGHQKPILLLDKKEDGEETLCESIAPGNPKVGVMLPYAPVQLLLFTYDDAGRTKKRFRNFPVCATVCFPTPGKSGSVPMIQ